MSELRTHTNTMEILAHSSQWRLPICTIKTGTVKKYHGTYQNEREPQYTGITAHLYTIHCYIQNMKGLGLVVWEKKIFSCFSHDAPGAGTVWSPGARLAGFIKRTTIHCYTQNMKALGLVVSEKKIFLRFSHCKSMEDNNPREGAIFDPRGMVGMIYKEDHYTLLHTKYERSGPCCFGEEDFFMFFP